MRPGDTPVPIPNTTVKTRAADGTALETVWESRRLPDHLKKKFYQWLEGSNFCLRFLMTDKNSVKKICTLKTAYEEINDKIKISNQDIRGNVI